MKLILLVQIVRADRLAFKQLDTHGWILSNVDIDALVLKHQTISIYSAADIVYIVLNQFRTEIW